MKYASKLPFFFLNWKERIQKKAKEDPHLSCCQSCFLLFFETLSVESLTLINGTTKRGVDDGMKRQIHNPFKCPFWLRTRHCQLAIEARPCLMKEKYPAYTQFKVKSYSFSSWCHIFYTFPDVSQYICGWEEEEKRIETPSKDKKGNHKNRHTETFMSCCTRSTERSSWHLKSLTWERFNEDYLSKRGKGQRELAFQVLIWSTRALTYQAIPPVPTNSLLSWHHALNSFSRFGCGAEATHFLWRVEEFHSMLHVF